MNETHKIISDLEKDQQLKLVWKTHRNNNNNNNNDNKLLWDFNIQMDHLIPARRPDFIIIKKKKKFVKLSTLLSRRTTE